MTNTDKVLLTLRHRFQEGLQLGLACSFVGSHEEIQDRHQPYFSHQTPLWWGHHCSPHQQQHGRLVPNNTCNPTGMSILTHPLQHISGKDHDRCLKDHEGTVSIGGRTITNPHFADDINYLAGEEEELAKLVEHLNKASTAYSMEISTVKTKLMTDNTNSINIEIKVNWQKLETVTSFKYLGSVITDEGSKPEILSRIAQVTATLTRLKPVWNERNISLCSKIQLMHSLITSIFLHACESWTLTAELQRRTWTI